MKRSKKGAGFERHGRISNEFRMSRGACPFSAQHVPIPALPACGRRATKAATEECQGGQRQQALFCRLFPQNLMKTAKASKSAMNRTGCSRQGLTRKVKHR